MEFYYWRKSIDHQIIFYIDWSVANFGENELVMVVRKEGQKLEQNIIPYKIIEEEREKNKREIKSGKKRSFRPTMV